MAWQWQENDYDYMSSSSSSTSYKKTQAKAVDKRRESREQHMQKLEIWLCKICDKEYTTKAGLNRHFTTIHEQPKPKPIQNSPKAVVPYRGYSAEIVCHICGNDFASQSNLTRHLNTVHQRAPAKAGSTSVSNSTKMVQKNQTKVVINMYKPVFYQ